jgi:hypothetical protein
VQESSNERLEKERNSSGKEEAVEVAPRNFLAYQEVLLSVRIEVDIRYCGWR